MNQLALPGINGARLDGWSNPLLGFGGSVDKTDAMTYAGVVCALTYPQLTAMYATEDLSAKIVDVYPREALREGFEVGGLEGDAAALADKYMAATGAVATVLDAAIWGRLYGGAAIWLMTPYTDARELATPLRPDESVYCLRVFDRRNLNAIAQPATFTRDGKPTLYQVTPEDGGTVTAVIHASRLILFPGAHTDSRTRAFLGYWDYSVLQRAYNALRSGGHFWKSAEALLAEASVPWLKIKDLWSLVAAGQKDALTERMATFNQLRSISRAIPLDKDNEEYGRENLTFAGVDGLVTMALKRVAAAAEVPVTVLMGEAPAGLNATGDADLRWFLMRVNAYRHQTLAPRVERLARVLLTQGEGSPVAGADMRELAIRWPQLWSPSAAEQADIYSKTAAADVQLVQSQILLPEEVALSRFGDDGYSQDTEIERALRVVPETPEALAEETSDPAELEPTPTPETPATPATPGGPTAEPAAAGEVPIQQAAMNGAQVTALAEVVRQVAAREIPRESGKQIIALAFQLTAAQAELVLGPAGAAFEATPPPAPGPFGGPPKPPDPEPAED